jgi:hypothetical protein
MCALNTQDQGIIVLPQQDYLPILVESFLIDRKSQGLPPTPPNSIQRSCYTL